MRLPALLQLLKPGLVALFFCLASPAINAESITLAFGQTPYDFKPLLDQFAQRHGIEIVSAPSENYDLKAELIKTGRNKKLPDVFVAPFDYTAVDQGSLAPLDANWLHRDLSPRSRQLVSTGDSILGVPLVAGNHLLLYFNRKAISQPASSWTELEQQKATIPDDMRFMSWAFNGMYYFIPFLSAFDALPIRDNRLNLNSPGMVRALNFYWTLPDKGVVQPSCHITCFTDGFAKGEFAYVIDGIWSYRRYSSSLGEDFGAAVLPSIDGKPMQPYFSAHVFSVIDKPGQNLALLRELALFLQSYEAQAFMWRNETALPTNDKLMQEIKRQGNANEAALIAQLEHSVPIPDSPYMAVVWEAMAKGFNRYGADILNAKEASDLMQHLAERTVARQQQ